MKKTTVVALTIFAALLFPLSHSFGQSSIAAGDTIGQKVTVPEMSEATAANRDEFSYGGNSPYRRGCILHLCDNLIKINAFGFGNTGERSILNYKWTVTDSAVVSFSISTIEYDAFNNPLTRESWIIPLDDGGGSSTRTLGPNGRMTDGVSDTAGALQHGFDTHPYYSSFSGVASNANLLEHFTPDQLLDFVPSFRGIEVSKLEKFFPPAPDYNHELAIPGGFGPSTRFTVVTFISHVRFNNGYVWDAPGDSLSATFLKSSAISGQEGLVLYAWGFTTYNTTWIGEGINSIESHRKKDPPVKKEPGS